MEISVVTPTYNRAGLIVRLYNSLLKQTNYNFNWVVIDDGSFDNTEETIKNLKNNNFEIIYYKQKNGGKARALNRAFSLVSNSNLYVIVDSDDYLLPDAIELIETKYLKYKDFLDVGAIYFRYMDKTSTTIHSGKNFLREEKILSRNDHDDQYSKDDGVICYFQRAVKKYRYPEYPDENYVGPTVLQMDMAEEFKIAFTNEIIGIAEYQENGLTKFGRKLRLKNPLGMTRYSQLQFLGTKRMKKKIISSTIGMAYFYISGLSIEKVEKFGIDVLCFPLYSKAFGYLLYKFWQFKYLKLNH
ncbi:Glycosyltransferase involved in cell wall bisynthesis [Eubacterium callanderi]|uniref:Glycosyltransferase involved in cell wall bisynthesis n=3 Tax=Eubacterium callanderi TaxID=53442 RepID=A0AB74F2S5_9FIRM|nr:glycosyltransferase family 2 protein [Eubacterium callanderi]OEZ03321.1 hyaluronan synthase [[Butyribacterium] methylotrophicum]ADO37676.1 family 2 glycosyltransferase [Eubacterium callanderi]MDY7112780.1 hypothetical protein [Eubacterium callanderi]WPK82899.1 hypothetical protein EUCAMar_04290 [Eubacterium callanderi]SHM07508.1 Glycosyltransferase involved in cell wall bisynthesis [Eubacterium callanderi]